MNERIPSSPPLIAPVADTFSRPLWSVMIPVFNNSTFLKETLESVLLQDPGLEKMQIEVIDDASTDVDVEQLVKEVGKGRVSFFRQQKNLGSLRNFETCINRARGHWVHILHGDDLILKGFYNEIESLFSLYPQAGAAYTGFWNVHENGNIYSSNEFVLKEPGIINNWLTIISQSQKVQTPAMVVKRKVYEKLGGFFAVHYGEDWEMWVRIAAHYPVAHSPKKLAQYRMHDNNITAKYFLSGQNIKDITTVINYIQNYLPVELKKKSLIAARRNWSHYFARTSDRIYHGYKSPEQAFKQSKMAFKLHSNSISLYYLSKTFLKILLRYEKK